MVVLRSALFNLYFFGLTFLMVWPGTILRFAAPHRVLAYARVWAALVLAGLRVLCGIRLDVTGIEHLPADGPALIAPLHQSAFDTVVWLLIAPRCCYVLKRELLRIPLFGGIIRASRMIAIDRAAAAGALRTLMRDGAEAAAAGRQIVIFPQGTRSDPGSPIRLQPGVAVLAMRTGLPVIPAATDSGRYWGRRSFRKQRGTVRITILPPIPAEPPHEALLGAVAERLRIGAESLARPVENSVH